MSDKDKKFNIFEHHHDHGGCDCDDHLEEDLDPAQQSMADALRVSFGFLKIIMIIVVISYFFSGFFTVKNNHVAVKLRFGKRVGQPITAEQSSGLNFALPYPFEKVISVPNTPQQISMNQAFWYDMSKHMSRDGKKEMAHGMIPSHGPLDPRKDGSLLTKDMNLMHLKCQVSFKIGYKVGGSVEKIDAQLLDDYLENVKDLKSAGEIVAATVEQSIILQASKVTASDLKKGSAALQQEILSGAQKSLNRINAGIGISSVTLTQVEFPVDVNLDLDKVTSANAESAKIIEKAKENRNKRLIGTAGAGHKVLLALLDRYDIEASKPNNQKTLDALDAELDIAFSKRLLKDTNGQKVKIEGEVYKMMVEAESFRSTILQETNSKVTKFNYLLDKYLKSPELFKSKSREEMYQLLLSHEKIEKTYLPEGQIYLELSRDPEFRKRMAAIKADEEAASYEEE